MYVTFSFCGCSLMSRSAAAGPKSRRLRDPSIQDRTRTVLESEGVRDWVERVGWLDSPREHLKLHRRMDIALDPFLHNGTTTTCEALWISVPVVILSGDRYAGRVGT